MTSKPRPGYVDREVIIAAAEERSPYHKGYREDESDGGQLVVLWGFSGIAFWTIVGLIVWIAVSAF